MRWIKTDSVRGCTGEFPPRKKKKLPLCSTYAKKKGKKRRAEVEPAANQNPLALADYFSTPSYRSLPPVGKISRCSYHEAPDLATQWHGGITCACHCVAKIASLWFPGEKNRPQTPQSASTTMGFPLPSKKYPLAQQVSRPPPHPTTHSSPDPPNTLSTWRNPEGARKDTKKSSNRPDVKILFDPPTETNQRPSPPSSAPCASTRDNNITKRRRLANRGAGAPGGSRR